ncbi:zinc ribbon domain-containing protein [Staphylococcus epidermidis]|uniref:zinc-ribbon domain-containing protein n=1 Tax=Staphylococcus epidermidis TaxID=1282 RepID=UPI0012465051|nr:zinc ribbon domain-containing protein [Staphylococcus epidermidis]KAA9272596.1 zinc ribbon domain-containing protein [Staphylococcus epidermidis]MDH8913588.1 zinc ribbon domain-containing protein [Staphylococcus epidermidis]MDH8941601.1 zinc ribbon domain-containing protein [Staphylococcus epidermidis]MDH9661440.1 zinc ribbon domain-containing protein [Staphylococcus epidermidis]MDH9674106.1 zinc ribbon domain-containing protein [Staphylococcus epidermidis]
MKYCANCGHKINNNQSFCNNCGAKLHDSQSNQQSNHNKIDKVRGVNDRYTYHYRDNNQHKRSGFEKVLIAILAVVILGLLVYGLYFAYQQFKSHNSSNGTTQSQSSNTSDDNAHGAQIDIFSDTFDQSYIKAPSKDGYAEIYNGMSRTDVETKYGQSNGTIYLQGSTYEKYGDLAVMYDEYDDVSQVIVTPSNITEDDYIEHYGEPDDREGNIFIYDAYKDNDFSVLVTIKDGMVLAIENVDQLPSNSSDDSDSNEVSSKSEARAIANDVLDSSDWIHSVDEGEFSYRVNYGRENEDRAHRAIIVEKNDGSTSEWDGDEWDY